MQQQRVKSNLNSSHTDGSFTMANSNSFLSPYEILPIAEENKYLVVFFYFFFFFSFYLYVVCTHKYRLIKVILLRTRNISLYHCKEDRKDFPITKTCLNNFDPLKLHFYIVKLGFTGVNIIFLISAYNIYCGYSLEPPRRGCSNENPQSMFYTEK